MIPNSKVFYESYLKDYHKIKATYLKKILEGFDAKYEKEFFGYNLNEDEKNSIKQTIKGDLRQTYFHSIETFFELFFALDPRGKEKYDDKRILINLTNSVCSPKISTV